MKLTNLISESYYVVDIEGVGPILIQAEGPAQAKMMLAKKLKGGPKSILGVSRLSKDKAKKSSKYMEETKMGLKDLIQEGPFDKSKISQDLEQSYKSYVDAVFALTSAARKAKDPKMDKILKNIKKETQALMDHVSGNYTDLDFK